MRTRTVWLMTIFLIGFTTFSSTHAQDVTDLLTNGGFEDGVLTPWSTYGSVTSEVVTEVVGAAIPEGLPEGNYCLHLDVAALAANNWDIGLKYPSQVFEQGKHYTLSIYLKCGEGTVDVRLKPERDGDPWEGFPEQIVTVTEEWTEYNVTTPVFTETVDPAAITIHIGFAVAELWVDGVRFYEGDYVPPAFLTITTATDPSPANGATDVRQDMTLSWEPGPYAATHNIYFGTNSDDVNNAEVDSPLLVGQGQTAATFDPPGLLDLGQTYYWRVDEVNAAPDSTVYKGSVWSFTAEPVFYAVQDVNATASAPTAMGSGEPEVMVDGTGLTDGQHAVGDATMWAGKTPVGDPIWLQFDFDDVYKLFGIHVWNYNGLYEFLLGFGLKDVTIEYATEPNEWVTLGDYQFARGTNQPTYTGERFDLDGIPARSIRINVNSVQYGGPQPGLDNQIQAGLSEIQFLYKPMAAREPQPTAGATEVAPATDLSWRPGRQAASHQIHLGTDSNAVADGAALVDTVTSCTYEPDALMLGTTYYWKVNEVNEAEIPSVWASQVWDFTTQEYITIDGFESYTDDDGNRIYQTWFDGYGSNDNGSQVGHDNEPYAEVAIRNSGRQAMPFYYRNIDGKAYSEAELALSPAQDLTANGADTVSLYYRGVPAGFLQLSDNSIIMNGQGSDIWGATDQFRFVYKQLAGNGSIVARIDHLDNTNEWMKAGVMIRERLDSDSTLVDGVITPTLRAAMQWRTDRAADMGDPDAGSHTVADSFELPQWIKLTRNGDVFTVQHSPDGQSWLDIVPETADDPTSVTVTMAQTVYIGLAVCSHDADQVAGARFSEIATTGNVTGQWQSIGVGTDQVAGNGIDTFYLAIEDSSGKKVTLPHADPYAVSVGVWTQWPIPLSALSATGLNTASITKIYIGIGDETQPSQNASGLMYIDDVAFGHPIQ